MSVFARRSFPVLARAKSGTSSAALVALILLSAILVFGLFVGIFRIARPHECDQDQSPTSIEQTEKDVEAHTATSNVDGILRSSPGSPLSHDADAQANTSLLIPIGLDIHRSLEPPFEAGNHTIPSSAQPRSNFGEHQLDLDVVTLSQQSVDNTARHSLASHVRSSVSSIIERYRRMHDDSSVYSDCSVGTARPERKSAQDMPDLYKDFDTSQSPYSALNQFDNGMFRVGQESHLLPMRDSASFNEVPNFSRPISQQEGYHEGPGSRGVSPRMQNTRHTSVSSSEDYTQFIGGEGWPSVARGLDKGKAPMRRNSIEVPPLTIRKMFSAPENTAMDHLSPDSLTTTTRPQRIGGYGGFSQEETEAGQRLSRLSAWRSHDQFGGVAGPSRIQGYNPNDLNTQSNFPESQGHLQALRYAGPQSNLQGSSMLPHSETQMGFNTSDLSSNRMRFPLHTNSMISGQSSVTPELYDPWLPARGINPNVEFRQLHNASRPAIRTEPRVNTESVYLGLAPPRESANFEWEEQRKPAQGEEVAQNQEAAVTVSPSLESSDHILSSDSSGLLAGSLSSSDPADDRGRSSRRRKRYNRLHNLVKKMLY